jgi:catechol 2,3-dioxygenase-like lactoylglutathione lyase family enzyme
MKRLALFFLIFCCASASAQDQPSRPQIVGIGSVRINLNDPTGYVKFYINKLGFGGGMTVCKGASMSCVEVNKHQRIDLNAAQQSSTSQPSERMGMLSEIDFETTDVGRLRSHLIAQGLKPSDVVQTAPCNLYFSIVDPERHRIGFIQYLKQDNLSHPENQVSNHLIHAGFVVHDRVAEDRFYRDILGFHVYWHGGMKDDETNWVDMQVPDGTDWLEYMLNVPANASHKTLGVMNHIALGVLDIRAAQAQLVRNGWKGTEEPKIGRDGKWQLNLYDPDFTRVELMEFTPVQKPCCSDYTGPHPAPQSPSKAPAKP